MNKKSRILLSTVFLLYLLSAIYQRGKPYEYLLLKLFADEIQGRVTEAYQYSDEDEYSMSHDFFDYVYEYKINDKIIEKTVNDEGSLTDEYNDVSEDNPLLVTVQYVKFWPTISQVKDKESRFEYLFIIFWVLFKTAIYLAVLILYVNFMKRELDIIPKREA